MYDTSMTQTGKFGLTLCTVRRTNIDKTACNKAEDKHRTDVDSAGTSTKENSTLGEARNNEAITSDCGERNIAGFVKQQNRPSLGVP